MGDVAPASLVIPAVLVCCAASAAQPAPVPRADDLARGRGAVVETLTDLMVERAGPAGDLLVERLLAEADSEPDTVARYLLLEQALRAARAAAGLPAALRAVDAMTEAFAVDAFALRSSTISALENRASVPRLAVVLELLALAEASLEEASDAHLEVALQLARATAERSENRVLAGWTERRGRELAAMRAAWQQVADATEESSARGEYLCFYRGDWERGHQLLTEPATLRHIAEIKGEAEVDGLAALRVAEHWCGIAESQAQPVAQRNLRRQALHWYRHAWPKLEGPEKARVTRQMDRLEDRLAEHPAPGRLRIPEDDALRLLVIDGGAWRVHDGQLLGRNTGEATRAVHPYAFRRIDSVTIRGGIRSSQGLNFRLAVGTVNVLFNWEVQPESHFYIGEQRVATQPRLLEPGREHDLRLRQLGAEVVVFLDGRPVFSGPGQLSGTVCVYPALSSEIFVTEVSVDGEIDPLVTVTEPIGHVR